MQLYFLSLFRLVCLWHTRAEICVCIVSLFLDNNLLQWAANASKRPASASLAAALRHVAACSASPTGFRSPNKQWDAAAAAATTTTGEVPNNRHSAGSDSLSETHKSGSVLAGVVVPHRAISVCVPELRRVTSPAGGSGATTARLTAQTSIVSEVRASRRASPHPRGESKRDSPMSTPMRKPGPVQALSPAQSTNTGTAQRHRPHTQAVGGTACRRVNGVSSSGELRTGALTTFDFGSVGSSSVRVASQQGLVSRVKIPAAARRGGSVASSRRGLTDAHRAVWQGQHRSYGNYGESDSSRQQDRSVRVLM